MSGHKPFKNLSDKLRSTPEGRAAVQREHQLVRTILALAQLRAARGVTQVELARAWEVSQANVSRVEHAEDMYLSTLRGYVAALGGRLEITAVFPDQTINTERRLRARGGGPHEQHCRGRRSGSDPVA